METYEIIESGNYDPDGNPTPRFMIEQDRMMKESTKLVGLAGFWIEAKELAQLFGLILGTCGILNTI